LRARFKSKLFQNRFELHASERGIVAAHEKSDVS
jgi:hypothetical protein